MRGLHAWCLGCCRRGPEWAVTLREPFCGEIWTQPINFDSHFQSSNVGKYGSFDRWLSLWCPYSFAMGIGYVRGIGSYGERPMMTH